LLNSLSLDPIFDLLCIFIQILNLIFFTLTCYRRDMENMDDFSPENVLAPPPPPPPMKKSTDLFMQRSNSFVSKATRDSWDRMFDEAHGADVLIHTDDNGLIYAHSNVIGMASDVIRGMMKQHKRKSHRKSISILGVPHHALRVFIRFLYSSCYEKQDMEDFAIHLLVLSHVYVVPHLKRVCESEFESSLLNKENVIDVFQLALLCDAPRLGLLCHRMILNNFEEVSTSEGWQAMKESHPRLQKELLRSVAYELNVIIQNLNNFLYPKVLYFHSFLMIFVSKFCLCRA